MSGHHHGHHHRGGDSGAHGATNGASLEDCHANFFALTDVCGIKWVVLREEVKASSAGSAPTPPLEDPVLQSYAKSVDVELLAVWRRVPKRDLAASLSNTDLWSQQPEKPSGGNDEKPKPLANQTKELWIFWYGDRPNDQFKRVINPKLEEIRDGSWDNGLPYEARMLLFKALNNLIERSLVAKDFLRLGKWFVQPFDGTDSSSNSAFHKSSHLSFSFHYFIHGESSVCASVDVRSHPPLRRLALQHLSAARSGAGVAGAPVQVVLAPYGLSATLTGVSYKAPGDVSKLLREWHAFYPLDQNRYFSQDVHGELVVMPSAVEVMVAGVRMVYPTCYVLVSDTDGAHAHDSLTAIVAQSQAGRADTAQTFRTSGEGGVTHVEPSAFSGSTHPLLTDMSDVSAPRPELAWLDAIGHGQMTNSANNSGNSVEQQQQQQQQQQQLRDQQQQPLGQWDFVNPCRYLKKPRRNRNREKSRDRSRFSAKIPFHKKTDLIDDLAWALGQADLLCGNAGGVGGGAQGGNMPGQADNKPGSMGPPGSVKQEHLTGGLASPASVGSVLTPKAPARTPGDPLLSPLQPASNGPLTPLDNSDAKPLAPHTPKSVPQYSGVASPFTNVKSVERVKSEIKAEDIKTEPQSDAAQQPTTATSILASTLLSGSKVVQQAQVAASTSVDHDVSNRQHDHQQHHQSGSGSQQPFKRPALPMKEYEAELQKEGVSLSDKIYDYADLTHWLNHPVKKFRPSPARSGDPLRPMYRRSSQIGAFDDAEPAGSTADAAMVNGATVNAVDIKTEPEVNGEGGPVAAGANVGQQKLMGVGGGKNGYYGQDPFEFNSDGSKAAPGAAAAAGADGEGGKQPRVEEENLFTSDGLKATMNDLDNLFDDSSDETDGAGNAPTPPDSNKPANNPMDVDSDLDIKPTISAAGASTTANATGKTKSRRDDPTGNLPSDQLASMYPTPPSHDHAQITSPAENAYLDADGHPMGLGPGTPGQPPLGAGGERMEWSQTEDAQLMFSSAVFSPIVRLYSDDFPPIHLGPELCYKPRAKGSHPSGPSSSSSSGQNSSSSNSPSTGATAKQPGMSPISPLTSVENPRSQHGPGSNAPGSVGGAFGSINSPASVSSTSNNYLNKSLSGSARGAGSSTTTAVAQSAPPPPPKKGPEANALMLNLVLSDTLLNAHRDHNFNSCTICVCTNEASLGNIRGRDAAFFKAEFAGDDDAKCSCGYSAVVNRRMAHQSGLFYEDEAEVTSLTEDVYSLRKKSSLLHLDNKAHSQEQFAEKAAIVDSVPNGLLELIQAQSLFGCPSQSAIAKHSKQYLKQMASLNQSNISMVELVDANDVIFGVLDQLKTVPDNTTAVASTSTSTAVSNKLDDNLKSSCMHKWTLLPGFSPLTSEDIIRVMRALQPVLNSAVHYASNAAATAAAAKAAAAKASKAKSSKAATAPTKHNMSVTGPLTWRQFHQMAGPSTKGHTDDQCEPLPVPNVTVGHEREFVSLSPLALNFWESLSLEPYSHARDVVYLVVAPDNDYLAGVAKTFFKNLSMVYEMCRLGRHVPANTTDHRDGIFRLGKAEAERAQGKDSDQWFDAVGDYPVASLLKLYAQVFRHSLAPRLSEMKLDKTLIADARATSNSPVLTEKAPASSPAPQMHHGLDSSGNPSNIPNHGNMHEGKFINTAGPSSEDAGKENMGISPLGGGDPTDDDTELPAVVIYVIDPFGNSSQDNCDASRLTNLGLLRAFMQLTSGIKTEHLKHNLFLQTLSLESVLGCVQSPGQLRMQSLMRGLAFSVYSQTQRTNRYEKDCKTLTGFGPASGAERFLSKTDSKTKYSRTIYQPPFVLALPPTKQRGAASDSTDAFGASNEKSSVLFVNYCLSEDQHWLLASASDDRGELLRTNIINIEIPNKARRKKASARRVGLKKLMDWILGVMSLSLVPWRLVVGRIGRIGHGELRGWSVLLSCKALKRASAQLREMCNWSSDVPTILSACLVSMEPDSFLRLMSDQFTPDERFGQTASNCQLSTPKDASTTHILVFPTSARAQSSQNTFADVQDTSTGDLNFDMDMNGLDFDLPDTDDAQGLELNDIFNDDSAWDGVEIPDETAGGSTSGSPRRNTASQPGSPNGGRGGGTGSGGPADVFRYGQEEPGASLEFLQQQPLALGYFVSTASAGPMPRWFWASCPHLESVNPVFLKSALHLNQANVHHRADDGFGNSGAASGQARVHSLDSSFTPDVLRYVLEGYNALSWLSLDYVTRDRKSCMPIHIQTLQQMYANLSSLI